MCPESGTGKTLSSKLGRLPGGGVVSPTPLKKGLRDWGLHQGSSEGWQGPDVVMTGFPHPLHLVSRLFAVEELRDVRGVRHEAQCED